MTKLSKRRIKTLSKSKKTMKKKIGGIRFPRLFNTLEWFKMHKQEMKDENSEFKKLEKSEKLENLRTFLLSKLPDASENTIKLIDEKVKLINDDKYNELKDESDFYGGKRTRKRRTK
jgi:hypothetical protein